MKTLRERKRLGVVAFLAMLSCLFWACGSEEGSCGDDCSFEGTSTGLSANRVPPTVSWKAPASGATFTGKVPISSCEATVSAPAAIAYVDFFVDGRFLNKEEFSPYNCLLDTIQLTNGVHRLEARAVDVDGNATSATVSFTAKNTAPVPVSASAPTVAWEAPAAGANLSGSSAIKPCRAQASDSDGIASVDFYMDGVRLNTENYAPYDCILNPHDFPDGSHKLEARASDTKGNARSAVISVNIGTNDELTVTWTAPISGATISGTLPVESCEAMVAAKSAVSKVDFFVDGNLLNTEEYAPYNCILNTTALTDGNHQLKARVTDVNGKTGSATITVQVKNAASAPTHHVGAGYAYNTDGVADDVQINKAIQDALAGETVYVHRGTYSITRPIVMKSGITLRGDGPQNTTLLVPPSALLLDPPTGRYSFNAKGKDESIIRLDNLSNVTIYGFKIDGNDGQYNHCGNGWENAIGTYGGGSNLTVHDLYITRINGDGIRVNPYPGYKYVDGARIYNLEVRRSGHDAIKATAVKNWKISNINVEIYINYGVRFTDAINCELSWSTFYATEGSGNAAVGLDGSAPGLSIHHNRFQNINSYISHGILTTLGTGTVTISNNIFHNCEDGAITYWEGSGEDLVIDRNIFDSNPFAINARRRATITNNIITNQSSYAIRCYGSGNCTASNNNINGGSTSTSNVSISGTRTGAPGYATSGAEVFIPLSSSAPLYSVMSSWKSAGYGVVTGP